ncbi:capsular exopolysaccharide family [Methyloglobulus morosus KoM1]|uniref:Capsular exopolysaccharide family n=1 Tax=Methyloglobulus morosus KoM1 TaxID=1116472 RepID=V5C6R5_9GAMM|nr:CpsD/CapB family tyrosine-protein kinase [Methyloglobulus morosus]ESS72448.1 capsular exopolysaccharide family [Methyloglobulus morosus KoM1]
MVDSSESDSLDKIRYSKTRITPLDAEVLQDNRIIMGLYNDQRADLFRVLRTNILKQLRENNWNSFFITSATPGAGKSWVATNLAIAIALEGNQTVLLVDADLRHPSICHHLGLNCKFGLIDYLSGVTSLEHILIHPKIENLVLLPGKESKVNYSELISSPKMVEFIKDTKSRYESRIIIFDIPPLFIADDAMLYMSYCDAALLVVEDDKNTTDELQQSMQILEETNLLGTVLNKSRQQLPSYKYGYGYGYSAKVSG